MTHAEARQIIVEAFRALHGREPSPKEALYTQAIANLETAYGRAGKFAEWAAEGKYNWGGLQRGPSADGTCPPGTEGVFYKFQRCLFVFSSDLEAAKAYLRNLTGKAFPERNAGILAAMNEGTSLDVANAMSGPTVPAGKKYFEEPVEQYARGIDTHVGIVSKALGAAPSPSPPTPTPSTPSSTTPGKGTTIALGLLGTAAVTAWVLGLGPFERPSFMRKIKA